jgi:biopolymer transport protein ExbD
MDVNLPIDTKTQQQQIESDISQVMLEYTADRRISVNKQEVTMGELENRLRAIYEQRKVKTMFIWGAETLRYKEIIDVIDAAKMAGVDKVGIVTAGMRKAAGVTSGN